MYNYQLSIIIRIYNAILTTALDYKVVIVHSEDNINNIIYIPNTSLAMRIVSRVRSSVKQT
jgi:hypothetical protein